MGKPSSFESLQREGNGENPRRKDCKPFPSLPGMTGAGAPVTEQLRCLHCRRIRVVPRVYYPRPYFGGEVYFLCPSEPVRRLAWESPGICPAAR